MNSQIKAITFQNTFQKTDLQLQLWLLYKSQLFVSELNIKIPHSLYKEIKKHRQLRSEIKGSNRIENRISEGLSV